METQPPALPDEPEHDPYNVGGARKTLRVLLALLIPPGMAAAGGIFALLMMVFAADSGMRDEALAEAMIVGVMSSIGLFALCGIPAAFAVVAPKQRRKLWWRLCFGIAAVSVVATLVCLGFYISAVMK